MNIKNLMKKLIPSFLLNWYHFLLAFLGAVLYQFPSKNLVVIGVTGTKGKSTVVSLIGRILEEAGYKVGWISSLSFKIGDREWLNPYHLTMPGRFLIQKTLREMVKEGCRYAILEVTSEGILQHRHQFIDFDIAVFTNLAPEHIERHGSFEKYQEAKGKLFQRLKIKNTKSKTKMKNKKISIINLDDENANYFLQFPADQIFGYGINFDALNFASRISNSIQATDIKASSQGIDFVIKNTSFYMSLLGKFNIYNALSAIAVGVSQGISLEICERALEKIKSIPGRMELIDEGQNFTVIVDLAHTPNSFEEVFKTVQTISHQKIISVFGSAGGGRDKWKRPVLGEIASYYSAFIILCNEDSYEENLIQILEQIESGIKDFQSPVIKILDRRAAIRKALSLAQPNDIVLILGKGTEQTMVIGEQKIPWDDRKVAREELRQLLRQKYAKYEILEHKADLKIRVFGKTKEELFQNALWGMQESLKSEARRPKERIKRKIKIKSLDLPALLVDFLSEVLYLVQVNKEIYTNINFKKFLDTPSTNSGQAEIEGELIGQKVERFGEDIKAVTHHSLDIHQKKDGGWEATILFDI